MSDLRLQLTLSHKKRDFVSFTNAAISKATLMSFPLVGNLSENPRRIAGKPQWQKVIRMSPY